MKNKIWLNLVLLLLTLNVYSQTFDELMTIGKEKYDKKDYKGAIISINKAIELNPKNSDAYFNRGNCKDDLGDKKGAIDDYSKAIELNPKLALAYMNRGNCKSDLGDKKGACIDLNKALDLGLYQAEKAIKDLCK